MNLIFSVHCEVSEWGEWSACFQQCAPNNGDVSLTDRCRWRHIIQKPEGDGVPCPDKLADHGDCPLCPSGQGPNMLYQKNNTNTPKNGGKQADKYEQTYKGTYRILSC